MLPVAAFSFKAICFTCKSVDYFWKILKWPLCLACVRPFFCAFRDLGLVETQPNYGEGVQLLTRQVSHQLVNSFSRMEEGRKRMQTSRNNSVHEGGSDGDTLPRKQPRERPPSVELGWPVRSKFKKYCPQKPGLRHTHLS